MTPQDHAFLLALIAHQNAKFNTLVQALTAANVLQPDDLAAYTDLRIDHEPEKVRDSLRITWKHYQLTAADLGITTGLEDTPPFPNRE
jgi:hypothetical protein